MAIRDEGLEVFEQAVQGGLTRSSDAILQQGTCPLLGRSGKHLLAMEISPFAQCRHPQALPASPFEPVRYLVLRTGGEHEATEISLCARRRGSMAARRARTAGRQGLARRHARHDLNHAQRFERWRVSGRHAATRLCRRTEPCHRLPLARRPPRAAAGTRRRIDPAQVRRSCDTGHPAGACRKAGRWRHSDRDGVDWRAGRGWPCGRVCRGPAAISPGFPPLPPNSPRSVWSCSRS